MLRSLGRRTAATTAALLTAAPLAVPLVSAAPAGASPQTAAAARASVREIHHRSWEGAQLTQGLHRGTEVSGRSLLPQVGRASALWRSPWVGPGFDFSELLPSWNARTPGTSRIEVALQTRTASAVGSWDTIALWASDDRYVARRTYSGQSDDLGSVNVDTWRAHAAGVTGWRVRVVFTGNPEATQRPAITRVGATASNLPATAPATSTHTGVVRELNVPDYSQMIHRGHYPRWGSGGQAWCSPTSTSMVLGYYGRLPRPRAYAWVDAGHPDPWVDYAARMTFDYAYNGAGNWPFNTAYAATRVTHGAAFVTRLRHLGEAERFIAAGIPLVVSVSFSSGQLTGAPISSTAGHLLVITGFTRGGNVIVNDPAAASDASVRRVYDRAQFERVWLTKSGGLTYVIRDAEHPLPASRGNW